MAKQTNQTGLNPKLSGEARAAVKASNRQKTLDKAKEAGVPFPNPQNNAEKEANAHARNERKAKRREEKEAARLATMTPEEIQAEKNKMAEILAAAQAKAAKPADTPDDPKPVISNDTDADDKSANVPGVAVVAADATDTTLVVDEAPASDTVPVVLSDPTAPGDVKETVVQARKLTKAERKAAQAAERAAKLKVAETETRNGDAPTAETITTNTAGDVAGVTDSTANTGADSTASLATDTLTNNEEEIHVDPALSDGRTLTEHGKEADKAAEQATPDTPAETNTGTADPLVEEPIVVPDAVSDDAKQPGPVVAEPVEQPAPVVADVKPAEAKPTLTLVSDNPEDPKMIAAKAFYGAAFTPERAKLLSEALFSLNKAIQFEAEGSESKTKMAFGLALKKEAAAFEIALAMAA